jgi:hypothetical protein
MEQYAYDAGSAADFQSVSVRTVDIGERCVEGGLKMIVSNDTVDLRCCSTYWKEQTHDA